MPIKKLLWCIHSRDEKKKLIKSKKLKKKMVYQNLFPISMQCTIIFFKQNIFLSMVLFFQIKYYHNLNISVLIK